MNIYLPLSGRAQIITPTPVYQGSAEVDTITVQSPLPRTTALELWFVLPNEERTKCGPYIMALVTPSSGTDGLNYWAATLDRSITVFAGTVGMVINAISGVGKNLTSYACDFDVQKGMLPDLPPEPTPEVYERLLILMQANTVAIELIEAWAQGEFEEIHKLIDNLDLDEIFETLAELERVKNEILEQLEILGDYKQELFALVENLERRLTERIELLEGRTTALESKTSSLTAATNALSAITDSLIEQCTNHQVKISSLEVKAENLSANLDLEAERLTAFKQSTYKALDGINADVRQAKTNINRNRFEINQLRLMFGEIVDTLGLPITVGDAAALGLTVGQVAAQNWTVAEVAVFGQARLHSIA